MAVFGRNEIVAGTALAGTLFALAVPTSAQEADPQQDAFASGTTIVTAQKREQAIVDVPLSIMTLSKNDFDNLRFSDFGDYARLSSRS
jgi:outer membrane receptor protein involved in Fe transport